MTTSTALQSPCADRPAGSAAEQPAGRALRPVLMAAAPPPCWPSQALLGHAAEAHIRHGDALYRLRLTRQGKLILTK